MDSKNEGDAEEFGYGEDAEDGWPGLMVWSFYAFGCPSCHVNCAKNCQMVVWNLGENHETFFKMGLN